MRYDLAGLVSAMLDRAGVSDAIQCDLNNHSTISLGMKDNIPDIYIKCEDDEVWVWSKLCEYNISNLAYCSKNLLPIMFDYDEEYFYCGQPCLYPVDGSLELRAQIKDKYLESTDMLLAILDRYLSIMQDYRIALS